MLKSKSLKSVSLMLTVSMVIGMLSSLLIVPEVSAARSLSNPNASQEAKNVYNYICSVYGSKMLSAQMESTWVNNNPDDEMDYIKSVSGKLPAIRGLDFINGDYDGVVKRATEWWNRGGIPTICWHWGTPPNGDAGYESSKGTIDVAQAVTPGTTLNTQMLANMDKAAEALKKLQAAGVPVLWRPFHEFDGGWFWWGKGGGDNFIKLWRIMYDRFTNYHKLNNLIWVLGYSGEVKSGWYPGNAYVDIAGADTYSTGTQNGLYNKVKAIVGNEMPVCYHECGAMPDPDAMLSDGTRWSWFMVWHTSYIKQTNSAATINKVYNHNFVITLDELPNLKGTSNPGVTPASPTPSPKVSVTPASPTPSPKVSENPYDYKVETIFSSQRLVANQMFTAKVTVTNTSSTYYSGTQDVLLIVGLYDKNNTMSNVSYISKGIPYQGVETLSAGFKLPSNVDGYSIRAFVWDGTDLKTSNMIPLSNVTQLP